ncbi:MAG: DUF922 domain-containing protein [Pseudomonadota bacterium]
MRSRAGGWAVFTVVLWAFTASTAHAETTFRQRAEYFDISGYVNSRKEMWDAIRDWGPSGTGGKLIVGTAQPRFGYSYKFKKKGGRCYVTDLKVSVGVVLRLPQWNAKGFAKPELQRYFDCVLRTVTVHEKRHGQIAYETGQQIERAMMSDLDGSSCNGLKQRAKSIFHRVIAEGGVRQTEFDRRDYARRRYQQCNNSDGPQVDLNANAYRRSVASTRPPTRRFDVDPPKRRTPKPRRQQRTETAEKPTIDAEASIKTISSALGGFRFAALFGALACAAFALFMWWAVRHERNKEFGLAGVETNGDVAVMSNYASPVAGRRRTPPLQRPKSGFGKRSRR